MSVANPVRGLVPIGTMSTHGDGSPAAEYLCAINSALVATNGWPTANMGIFVPVVFPPCPLSGGLWPLRVMGWQPGTVSGNIDAGVYDAAGTRLYSAGSTAQSAALALQTVSPTLDLPGGLYYIGMSADNTTGKLTYSSGSSGLGMSASGVFTQASVFPLPSSITVGGAALTTAFFPWVFLGMQAVL